MALHRCETCGGTYTPLANHKCVPQPTEDWMRKAAEGILGYSDATCGDFDDDDLPNIVDHIAKSYASQREKVSRLVEASKQMLAVTSVTTGKAFNWQLLEGAESALRSAIAKVEGK